MGQTKTKHTELLKELSQAKKNNCIIFPTPGARRNSNKFKKGIINVYCEKSKTIHQLRAFPHLTVKDIKEQVCSKIFGGTFGGKDEIVPVPNQYVHLNLNSVELKDEQQVRELEFQSNHLFKIEFDEELPMLWKHYLESESEEENSTSINFK